MSSHAMQQAEAETAYRSLTAVYLGQAEKQEKANDIIAAMESYNKCLQAADQARDLPTAAKANYRLAMLYYQQEKWEVSHI